MIIRAGAFCLYTYICIYTRHITVLFHFLKYYSTKIFINLTGGPVLLGWVSEDC